MPDRNRRNDWCFIRWLVSGMHDGSIHGKCLWPESELQEPRRACNADDDGAVGNTGQPSQQPTRMRSDPLITFDKGPIVAAFVTAAASLLTYLFTTMHQFDARLDELEKQTTELLDKDGNVRPSKQGLEAYYEVQRLQERINALHGKTGGND